MPLKHSKITKISPEVSRDIFQGMEQDTKHPPSVASTPPIQTSMSQISPLQHVFKNVLGFSSTQTQAAQSWFDHHGWEEWRYFTMDQAANPDHILTLRTYKYMNTDINIEHAMLCKLKIFGSLMTPYLLINKGYISEDTILSITRKQFNEFRISQLVLPNDGLSQSPGTPTSGTSTPRFSSRSQQQSPPSPSEIALTNFSKGTKRDPSAYPIFKNPLYYDSFQRPFYATLKAQGL